MFRHHGIFKVSNQTINSQYLADRESDIETLARETDMPVETVHKIYEIEHAKLDQVAKIKTYVPVLIRRRVKELLRTQHSAFEVGIPNQPSA